MMVLHLHTKYQTLEDLLALGDDLKSPCLPFSRGGFARNTRHVACRIKSLDRSLFLFGWEVVLIKSSPGLFFHRFIRISSLSFRWVRGRFSV